MLQKDITNLKKKIIARGWDYKEGSWIIDKKERDLRYVCDLLESTNDYNDVILQLSTFGLSKYNNDPLVMNLVKKRK